MEEEDQVTRTGLNNKDSQCHIRWDPIGKSIHNLEWITSRRNLMKTIHILHLYAIKEPTIKW
jgi:hypothetical protein